MPSIAPGRVTALIARMMKSKNKVGIIILLALSIPADTPCATI